MKRAELALDKKELMWSNDYINKEITMQGRISIICLMVVGLVALGTGCASMPDQANFSVVDIDANLALSRASAASSGGGDGNSQNQNAKLSGDSSVQMQASHPGRKILNISLIRVVGNLAGFRSSAGSSRAGADNTQVQNIEAEGQDMISVPLQALLGLVGNTGNNPVGGFPLPQPIPVPPAPPPAATPPGGGIPIPQ